MGVPRSRTKSPPSLKSSATTENSGIKKHAEGQQGSLCRSKLAKPTKYIVTREIIDYHNDPYGGLHDTTVIGKFSSKEEANNAARADLFREWDEDFFERYEVRKDNNGLVIVTADCPEGEVMTVRVREAPKKSRRAKKLLPPGMRRVFLVKRKTIDYHADRRGRIHHTTVVGSCSSRKEANQVARTNLLNDWSMDFFDAYDVEKKRGLVEVTAICPEGEVIIVTVEEAQRAKRPDEDSEEDSDEDSEEDSD